MSLLFPAARAFRRVWCGILKLRSNPDVQMAIRRYHGPWHIYVY
jgi:hypothetical protein